MTSDHHSHHVWPIRIIIYYYIWYDWPYDTIVGELSLRKSVRRQSCQHARRRMQDVDLKVNILTSSFRCHELRMVIYIQTIAYYISINDSKMILHTYETNDMQEHLAWSSVVSLLALLMVDLRLTSARLQDIWWRLQHMLTIVSIYDCHFILQSYHTWRYIFTIVDSKEAANWHRWRCNSLSRTTLFCS